MDHNIKQSSESTPMNPMNPFHLNVYVIIKKINAMLYPSCKNLSKQNC